MVTFMESGVYKGAIVVNKGLDRETTDLYNLKASMIYVEFTLLR